MKIKTKIFVYFVICLVKQMLATGCLVVATGIAPSENHVLFCLCFRDYRAMDKEKEDMMDQ